MARVKRSTHARKKHRAVLEKAKGYYGDRSRTFRSANEQVMHSGQYAFHHRRAKKGEFRSLWIQRINAGCRAPASSSTARCSPTSPCAIPRRSADLPTSPVRRRPPGPDPEAVIADHRAPLPQGRRPFC